MTKFQDIELARDGFQLLALGAVANQDGLGIQPFADERQRAHKVLDTVLVK